MPLLDKAKSGTRRSWEVEHLPLKSTEYFQYVRTRPDRARILDEWIISAVEQPIREEVQSDGRMRRWTYIDEEARYLRVILLDDGETVHNAFFDRDYKP